MLLPVNENINLTEIFESDIPVIAELANDELIHRNTLSFPFPYSEQHACEFYKKYEEKRQLHGFPIHFAIRNHQGEFMGVMARLDTDGVDPYKDEVGYWLGRPFSGQGIATKALDVFVRYWFDNSSIVRFSGCVFPENAASIRVLEKAGFQQEGLMRRHTLKNGELKDVLLYARLKG